MQYMKWLFLSAVQQYFYKQKCLHCNGLLLFFVFPGTSRNWMTAPSSLCCVTSLRQLKALPPSGHLGKICKTIYQREAWGSGQSVQLPWSMSEGKLLNLKNFIKLFQKKRTGFCLVLFCFSCCFAMPLKHFAYFQ